MTTFDKVVLAITLSLLFSIGVLVPIAYNQGYRAAESEHREPAYPFKQIEYVPPDHNRVMVDAKGYYWVESKTSNAGDLRLEDCKKCHGDRWNQMGGWRTGQSLWYFKDGAKLRENVGKREYPNNEDRS